ncbi:sugar ABC transporter substrate-binding protein [Phreatobacter stygius]|uniref:Sugar ABC transporter substrate-binding protein n=2 Tax=Phreatobacter stygius TaxID=1940610 RepID=A0A4D7BNM5_9HYPH|nr:sugar ABC transporter substrate-binding protein [Phreatobacter stygius]
MLTRPWALAASVLLIGGLGCGARAETTYRLSPGDIVEIGLAGMTEQRHRAVIQLDGTIALPSVGSVAVAGLTSAELQTRMENLLPTKVFRRRTPDGREQILIVKPEDVTTSVAEYRPIYVTGDVLTPGQQTYRPLMTIRQAVTTAGGYSLLRSRATQAGTDPADLRRDHDLLWTDYIREYFRVLRTHAELAGQDTFDQTPPRNAPLPETLIAAIGQAEAEALRVAQADYRLEQSFLDRAAKETDEQIVVLQLREQEEERGVQADMHELDRVNRLFGSGNLVSPRVTESRRSLLLSSSRRLETTVQLMRARRQVDEYRRQLERLTNQRQVTLQLLLRDLNVRLADLGVRIQAVSEKLRPLGGVSTIPAVGARLRSEVAIMRKIGEQWQRLPSPEDAEVQPGDVIEVAFRDEATAASAVH